MNRSDSAILRDTSERIAALSDRLASHGGFTRAEKILRRAVVLHPDEQTLWDRLGTIQSELGKTEEAIHSLSAAIDLGHVESRVNRGLCFEAIGRPSEAEADYRAVLSVHPDDVDALVDLGTLQLSNGDTQGALETLTRATALDPQANWQLSSALEAAGDVEGAIRAARAAVASGEERAYLELAELLMDRAPREKTISYFEKAIKAGRAWARRELIVFLDNEGLHVQALRLARSGIESGDRLCYAPLAVILQAEGELEEAAHYYRLAIAEGDVNYSPDFLAIEKELEANETVAHH